MRKLIAISLVFAVICGSVQAAQPKPPALIQVNATKLINAATASITQLGEMVKHVVDIAKIKDNPDTAAKIRAMLPANLKKAQTEAIINGKSTGKVVAEAFKGYIEIAPMVVSPVIHIVNNLINIIKNFGEALINPEAKINNKKAIEMFNTGITTVSAVLNSAETILKLLPGLPAPTAEEAAKAVEEVEEF